MEDKTAMKLGGRSAIQRASNSTFGKLVQRAEELGYDRCGRPKLGSDAVTPWPSSPPSPSDSRSAPASCSSPRGHPKCRRCRGGQSTHGGTAAVHRGNRRVSGPADVEGLVRPAVGQPYWRMRDYGLNNCARSFAAERRRWSHDGREIALHYTGLAPWGSASR